MMVVRPELVEGDLQEEEDSRTIREISRMADSIEPALQTTYDCPGLQEGGKMPLLDLAVWVARLEKEEGRREWEVVWEYYRKPCSSRTVMLARSAMPDRVKRSTLTQEAIRIMKNTSLSIPWSRRAELLSDFSLRLKLSGYSERYRETVIRSALAAWSTMVEEHKSGQHPLYREREWRKEERRRAKGEEKPRLVQEARRPNKRLPCVLSHVSGRPPGFQVEEGAGGGEEEQRGPGEGLCCREVGSASLSLAVQQPTRRGG